MLEIVEGFCTVWTSNKLLVGFSESSSPTMFTTFLRPTKMTSNQTAFCSSWAVRMMFFHFSHKQYLLILVYTEHLQLIKTLFQTQIDRLLFLCCEWTCAAFGSITFSLHIKITAAPEASKRAGRGRGAGESQRMFITVRYTSATLIGKYYFYKGLLTSGFIKTLEGRQQNFTETP